MTDRRLRRIAGGPALLTALGIILALGVRIALVVRCDPEKVGTRWSNVGDAQLYDRFGWNVAHEGVLGVGERPSAFVMPAYPLLVGLVYRVAGHRPGAVRWV